MQILSMTLDEVTALFKSRFGKGTYHSRALYKEVYKRGSFTFDHLPEFEKSGDLAERLAQLIIKPSEVVIETQEDGDVLKFALQLSDGNVIESVIIPHKGRNTLCVSSQIGCKLGCSFCSQPRKDQTPDQRTAQPRP